MSYEIAGAYSAIFTPFDAKGNIDFEMLCQIADFQMENGIAGFFACGSTGEGLLLSEKERIEVVHRLRSHIGNRAKLIAHVGHPSTEVACTLAKAAANSGADWVASVTPIYHGTTSEGTQRHYSKIASATDLPFMIYSLGGVINPNRDHVLFDIPNVCGLKYTGANFYSVQQLVRNVDKPIALMSGFDEQFVAGQSFGFHGGIGTTFNFAPRYYSSIHQHYLENNVHKAAELQAEINQVTHLMVQYENWSYRKAIMRFIGLDCGACRAPYSPLSEQEYEAFAMKLEELDILRRGEANHSVA